MPTIDVNLTDLAQLTGRRPDLDDLERQLESVKAELKRGDGEDVRVELQDTNRPDLWCIEGIARQLRQVQGTPASWRDRYGFLERPGALAGRIEVDPSVEKVRPFVAAFLATGYTVDDAGLKAFIQAQETLSQNYGRKRATVAIGIYDGSSVELPVRYVAVPLDDTEHAFVPLPPAGETPEGIPEARWKEKWTPAEILRDHPTGQEFAAALPGDSAPMLIDARGEVLSFPPIINSAGLGRVVPGMDKLFVEVTGTVLDQVLLAANILAANLRDRGAEISPVATRYPYKTARGPEVKSPHPLPEKRTLALPLERFQKLLGEPDLSIEDVRSGLEDYGLDARAEGDYFRVEIPPYRQDYLHEVDAVEDFAISRGYESFAASMPEEFTVGRLDPLTLLSDRARDRMIGYGFEEAISNILTNDRLLRGSMNLEGHEGLPPLHGGPLVRIANVMNASYSCLRDWLLPSLLEVESHSAGAVYPHRVFEVGEAAVHDLDAPLRSRTEHRVAGLIAHESANFSEAQGVLNTLLFHLGVATKGDGAYQLRACDHPSFIPGRVAAVLLPGQDAPAGVLGEIHPAVLASDQGFGIRVPCAAFELSLSRLAEL